MFTARTQVFGVFKKGRAAIWLPAHPPRSKKKDQNWKQVSLIMSTIDIHLVRQMQSKEASVASFDYTFDGMIQWSY
jgi:hypothetical protein